MAQIVDELGRLGQLVQAPPEARAALGGQPPAQRLEIWGEFGWLEFPHRWHVEQSRALRTLYSFISFSASAMRSLRRLPVHVEHLLARPQVGRRMHVAVAAPLHLQGVFLAHQRHLVDLAVAGDAADALVDMNAVIEIDEIGQVVHPHPLDRAVGAVALAHRLEHRRVRPDLRVAGHAGLGRRNAGKRAFLDRPVAMAAVDAEPLHVMLVAERNRLLARHAGARHIRRTVQSHQKPQKSAQEENRPENTDLRDGVGAGVKNLRHRASISTNRPRHEVETA